MRHQFDKQLSRQLSVLQPRLAAMPDTIPGNVESLRAKFDAFYRLVNDGLEEAEGVETSDHHIPIDNERRLLARWYQPTGGACRAAVMFLHGGGGMAASISDYHKILTQYVANTGVNFLALDYDLAPEHPGEAQAEQAVVALEWLQRQSERFAIDPKRIAIMGDSGGGGIAASTAVLARDRGLPLARQILIYPMLDDRTDRAPASIASMLTVTAQDVRDAWVARKRHSSSRIPMPRLAPARQTDYRDLAPAYIDVGDLDLFRDESLEYTRQLIAADVPVEFHLYAGVNHGFDLIAPHIQVTLQAMENRYRVIGDL